MGRRKKPTKFKLLEGNPGNRPLPKEPKPKPIAPRKIPKYLDKGARKAWRKLAPKLEKLGLLKDIDCEMFGAMCVIISRLNWIRSELNNADSDIKDRHFYMKEERLYLNLFKSYASEFGLSPSARTGLDVHYENEENSTFASLLDDF
jgi:P27 family predicted phage terminase small subunit